MEDIQTIAAVLVWFIAVPLVVLILLQGGSGDLSSSFGGGGRLDSTLGVGASRKMSQVTGGLALIFLALVIFMGVQVDEIGAIEPRDEPDALTLESESASSLDAEQAESAPVAVPDVQSVAQPEVTDQADLDTIDQQESSPVETAPVARRPARLNLN